MLELLFYTKAQVHYWHLQTSIKSEHDALGTYYEFIEEKSDAVLEAFQGVYGKMSGDLNFQLKSYSEGCAKPHLVMVKEQLALIRKTLEGQEGLQSMIDEISTQIDSTQYMLTLKH